MSLSGLISRAAGALRAEVQKAATLDHLHHQKELLLLKFHNETDLQRWIVGSDKDIGGFSSAKLDLTDRNTAIFRGHLSQNLPTDKQIVRSGYAAMRTKTPSKALFSEQSWDTLPFRYLCVRVKGDQRKYFVNIKSASFMKTDIYQHRLFLRTPGEWETIYIPFRYFSLTNNGNFVSQQVEMYREKVETVGFSLSDKREGPFQLEIDWIKFCNSEHTEGDVDLLDFSPVRV